MHTTMITTVMGVGSDVRNQADGFAEGLTCAKSLLVEDFAHGRMIPNRRYSRTQTRRILFGHRHRNAQSGGRFEQKLNPSAQFPVVGDRWHQFLLHVNDQDVAAVTRQ